MALEINQLKTGVTVVLENDVFMVIGVDHVKPGKGSAFARTKLKNLKSGNLIERTFKSDDKIEEAFIEEKTLQYSYKATGAYHFLDQNTFEELSIDEELIGEAKKFLKDNLTISVFFYNSQILNISLPNFVTYKITHTERGIKGDTAKGTNKSATIETGANIQVPLFVNVGDTVKVDTRTGEYIERV